MSDAQPQPSEPVDEAIRLAEQQLERRIQELRGSIAGGAQAAREHSGLDSPSDTPPAYDDNVASWETPNDQADEGSDWSEYEESAPVATYDDDSLDSYGSDAEFGTPTIATNPAPEPVSYEPEPSDEPPADSGWEDAVMRPVTGAHLQQDSPGESTPPAPEVAPAPTQPAQTTYGTPPSHEVAPPVTGFATERSLTPEETEQWAQMRTTMRQLQQSTDDLRSELPIELSRRMSNEVAPELAHKVSQQVTSNLTDQMERVVRDELSISNATVRQLQQQLPQALEQVERGLHLELVEPKEHIKRLQTDLPAMVEKLETTIANASITQEMERITSSVGEQQKQLSETLEFLQRHRDQIQQDHDSLKMAIGSSFREEFASTRRGVRELVDMEIGATLGDLAQASRATLDRLTEVTSELDRDRLQRVEDLELLVDAMTNGWQGLYSAVTRMFDRVDDFDSRMASVEQQVNALGSLDATVKVALESVESQLTASLSTMQQHLSEFQPAPVLVTVQHPNATVTQED